MSTGDTTVPQSWTELPIEDLTGTVMVIGAVDTGKSTFVRWVFDRLEESGRDVAVLDGDPGQSNLGIPSTITLWADGGRRSWFIGSTTPRGNMLALVTGVMRLAKSASEPVVLHDTTGFVDPDAGGLQLKRSLIDLLEPETVVALSRADSLTPILEPIRERKSPNIFELDVSDTVSRKDTDTRRAYRRSRYRSYFGSAGTARVSWERMGVWPRPEFHPGRLVGLCGDRGFVESLGIVREVNDTSRELLVETPLESTDAVNEIRVGELTINPDTYQDEIQVIGDDR